MSEGTQRVLNTSYAVTVLTAQLVKALLLLHTVYQIGYWCLTSLNIAEMISDNCIRYQMLARCPYISVVHQRLNDIKVPAVVSGNYNVLELS